MMEYKPCGICGNKNSTCYDFITFDVNVKEPNVRTSITIDIKSSFIKEPSPTLMFMDRPLIPMPHIEICADCLINEIKKQYKKESNNETTK